MTTCALVLACRGHGNELPKLLDGNDQHDDGRPSERTNRD
jgi:hypothetical protein